MLGFLILIGVIAWGITEILFYDEVEVRKKKVLNKIVGTDFLLTNYTTTDGKVTVKGLVKIGEKCHEKSVAFEIPEAIFHRESPEAALVVLTEEDGGKIFLQDHSQAKSEKYEGKYF